MDAPWAAGLDNIFLILFVFVFAVVPLAAIFIPWERFSGRHHGRGNDRTTRRP